MRRTIHAFISLVVCLALTDAALAQRDRFINIDGPTLKSRSDAAIKQGRSGSTRFWTAYTFDVRPGVAVDLSGLYNQFEGHMENFGGTTLFMGKSNGVTIETRNLGIFTLYEPDGTIARMEVYNLDRAREYSGYPVYWLGRGGNEESLNNLTEMIDSAQGNKISERATMAVGLHDDPRVAGILKTLMRKSPLSPVKNTAVFWLGQVGGEQAFLADIVRNEREPMELRRQAVFAIGVSKDATSLRTLKELYSAVSARELKRKIVGAVAINDNSDEAVDFLIQTASSSDDVESKKQALFWLGQKAGQKSLELLGNVANSAEAETEVQKSAVHAISRRPPEESVPMLIKIAKTHPKAEVRKQAFFWLARSGDERALELFKEILSK